MTDEELFEKYFKELLATDEIDELKRRLREDDATRKAFARYAEERSILVRLTGRLAGQVSRELPELPARRALPRLAAHPTRRPVNPFLIVAGLAAAAALLISIFIASPEPQKPADAPREVTTRTPPRTPEPRTPETPKPAPNPEPARPPKPEDPQKPEEPRKPDVPVPALKPGEPQKPEPPRRETVAEKAVATLERAEGSALKVSGATKSPARAGEALMPGQGLETVGAKSVAILSYSDGTRLRLEGETVARDLRADSAGKRLAIDQGILNAEVAKQPDGQPMTIFTPHGQAAVLGTTLKIVVLPSVSTRVEVRQGRVQLTRKSDAKAAVLLADQVAELLDSPSGNNGSWTKYPRKVETGTFTHITVALKTGTRSPSGPTVGFDALRVAPGGSEEFESMPRWDSAFDAPWGGSATWTIEPGGQAGKFLQAARPGPGSSVRAKVFVVPARSTIDVSAFLRCPSGSTADFWMEFGARLGVHAAKDFDVNTAEWMMIRKFDSSPPGDIEVSSLPKK